MIMNIKKIHFAIDKSFKAQASKKILLKKYKNYSAKKSDVIIGAIFNIKQSKIKGIILKLLNVYAYDKETLNIINPDYKNVNGNLIAFNDK